MTRELKILKGVLLCRLVIRKQGGTNYITKEEDMNLLKDINEKDLDEWIDSLKKDLIKSQSEIEAEREAFLKELSESEARQEYEERMNYRHERDEWDDFWDDRAKDCGAIRIF